MNFWRIKDWNHHFENNRTRDLKRMAWVPMPNKMDGDGYTELLDHPNGPAHFGAWVAIVEIASRCGICPTEQDERASAGETAAGCGIPAGGCGEPARAYIPRGTLIRDNGRPHDFSSLSRLCRISPELLREVLPRLVFLGWIEDVEDLRFDISFTYEIPQAGAGIPQEGALKPHEAGILTCARGTERNGTEEKRNTQNSTQEKSSGVVGKSQKSGARSYESDETFAPFVMAATEFWGTQVTPENFTETWQFTWKKLDFEQKAAITRSVQDRIGKENPRYVPLLPKYITSGAWKRPPRIDEPKPNGKNGHASDYQYTRPPDAVTDEKFQQIKRERDARMRS